MQILIFNLINLLGLILIAIGTWQLYGIPTMLIVTGGILLFANLFLQFATTRD